MVVIGIVAVPVLIACTWSVVHFTFHSVKLYKQHTTMHYIYCVLLLRLCLHFACSCMWTKKKKTIPLKHTAPDDNFNCELEENVAYVTAHNKLFSEACFEIEEEEKKEEEKKEEGEEECEENSTSVNGKIIDLDPVSPKLPCRQYLKEKEV